MIRIAITFAVFALAFDYLDRSPCAIWSDEPGDEVCGSCEASAMEDVTLADGTIVRELACQESP